MALTKQDLKSIGEIVRVEGKRTLIEEGTKIFLTKEDAKNFATKDDLKAFATKDDLKNLEKRLDKKITNLHILILTEVAKLHKKIDDVHEDLSLKIMQVQDDVAGLLKWKDGEAMIVGHYAVENRDAIEQNTSDIRVLQGAVGLKVCDKA